MPSERSIVTEIMKHLRGHLRNAVIMKHNDVGQKGVPDIQVARMNHTSWGEIKHQRPGRSLKSVNKPQQLTMCHEFSQVNNGRCWVIVYTEDKAGKRWTTVWQPRVLFQHLWPKLGAWEGQPIEVLPDEDMGQPLGVHGAFWMSGWNYGMLTALVRQFTP